MIPKSKDVEVWTSGEGGDPVPPQAPKNVNCQYFVQIAPHIVEESADVEKRTPARCRGRPVGKIPM